MEFNRFTKRAEKVFEIMKEESALRGYKLAGTGQLLYALIKVGDGVAYDVLTYFGLTADFIIKVFEKVRDKTFSEYYHKYDDVKPEEVEYNDFLKNVLKRAGEYANEQHTNFIATEHILLATLDEEDSVAGEIFKITASDKEVIRSALKEEMFKKQEELMRTAQRSSNLDFEGDPHGYDSVAARSMLERFGRNLVEDLRGKDTEVVIGRDREVERVIQILGRLNKNNPVLVGDSGVGKTAIVEGIAYAIGHGSVSPILKDKLIYELEVGNLVAGTKYRGEFEERFSKIIEEVKKNHNIILFVDEIHTLIGAGSISDNNSLDASNILKPELARGEIQLIGATTLNEYRKYIEKDPALERRFQPVMVEEPSREIAIEILRGIKPKYEEHHGVSITDAALVKAVDLSIRYINDRFLPDKAIDLIDEASSRVRYDSGSRDANDAPVVNDTDIEELASSLTGIPVTRIKEHEANKLMSLEDKLKERVIGQTEAEEAIAAAIRRSRAGIKDPNTPIGSFLLLGPSGVGKTEMSKALADALFGNEESIIRVDMSEYMEKTSISKLIGSPPEYEGHSEGGQLTERVRRKPYSVVLFDEIEKAHPDVLNILLQIIDEGYIRDSRGRRINFRNTIIIMTSNLGTHSIIKQHSVGFSMGTKTTGYDYSDYDRIKERVIEELKGELKAEFINRIDDIIVFLPFKRYDLKKIVLKMSQSLIDRLKAKGIELDISEGALDILASFGENVELGARPIKRAIQRELENPLSEYIISGKLKGGEKIYAETKDSRIVFRGEE